MLDGGGGMLSAVVNRLRGEVRLRVEAAFPERLLNLCAERGISLWDLVWEGEGQFTCRLSRGDHRRLRGAAGKLDCTLTLERGEGVPYFLRRFRKRYALLAGLLLCALWLSVGSFFIWDFTVEGNETVSDEEILRALQTYGVDIGTFGFSLDAGPMCRCGSVWLPRRSWMSGRPPMWWPDGRDWCSGYG